MNLLAKVVLVVTAVLILPATARAQVGEIAGQARDVTGAALPGVTVVVSSPDLIESSRTTTTDASGRFRVPALAVGTYQLQFTRQGLVPLTRSDVVLTSGFTANVAVELTVAGPTETLTVTGEPPAVDIYNARQQITLTGSEIADLPTGRDIGGVLLLAPGLTINSGICGGGIGAFCEPTVPAFNAHTAPDDPEGGLTQGRIMVDGMVINGGRISAFGVASGLTLDPATAREVVVTLSGSLGESETGGASLNVVPRTGGNTSAGTYYTSYLHSSFYSTNWQKQLGNSPLQPFQYDYDVNGTFGGPILRDRLWFHAYAGDRGVNGSPRPYTRSGAIYPNLNEGKFAANYVPDRGRDPLTLRSEYFKVNARLTFQATRRDKFNLYWDEQSSCANPCYGTHLMMVSPESFWSRQVSPDRLRQLSWTNPFTSRLLFEAGVSYVSAREDSTHHREYPNYSQIPHVCEAGNSVGRDEFGSRTPPEGFGLNFLINGIGTCKTQSISSGSINYAFASSANPNVNDLGAAALIDRDEVRSRASASYVTGSHVAKVGFESSYFAERSENVVNDPRLDYHYLTPSNNCLLALDTNPFACGNMTRLDPADSQNLTWMRPQPYSFQINTGVGVLDERVWSAALYGQDQWTLGRFSLSGALRYDHAASGYGASCIGPDIYVPVQADGRDFWCTEPSDGVRHHDLTPRWGVAWDVFGTGRTAVKWNMGKYLQAAGLNGLYVDDNDARRSVNTLYREWNDLNGNRIIDCDLSNPAPHTLPGGDTCGTNLDTNGDPSPEFLGFGRPPSSGTADNVICGRFDGASRLQRDYCEEAGQNLLSGWGKRRYEWQFGLGVQHEVRTGLVAEVTYNRRTYGNLTATDTILRGCDYYGPQAAVEDYQTCASRYLSYESDLYDFYRFTAPVDPRLPGGGGYVIRGLTNQKAPGALPQGAGSVTLVRDDLGYYWHGVDTNVSFRAARGLRVSVGTSTGRAVRDTCLVSIDTPNVQGREGNEYGAGCHRRPAFQTNVRGNASYVVPRTDVLVSAVYQFRPGVERGAALFVPPSAVEWEDGSSSRQGTPFYTQFGSSNLQRVVLLDSGDLYGDNVQLWDLRLAKNFRFGGRRLSVGMDVYNLFNSDAALRYNPNYTVFLLPDGTWSEDNPATADVEVNPWGTVQSIVDPRHLRLSVQLEF